VKQAWQAGRRRRYRPWVPEPGMWLQWDWGEGPRVRGRRTQLFAAWLAWSRFRVVIPTWDRRMGTLLSCLDATFRACGGVPAFALTDNEKTVTVEHVAGVPVRHPMIVAAGRHYGLTVHTCVPFDPESKGGSEATVRIAKADLVPTEANLAEAYPSMAALVVACDAFCATVNGRRHRETGAVPAERLVVERDRLHVIPAAPYAAALGETRLVNDDQTVRFGSVRYSTPPGHVDTRVWCRVVGDELAIVAMTDSGTAEIARHPLSTPGNPRILDGHYPHHPDGNHPRPPRPRPRSKAEADFLAIGDGAHQWLIEAAATGAARVRSKMAEAVTLAKLHGPAVVDQHHLVGEALGLVADHDLTAILTHQAGGSAGTLTRASEAHSLQPGTAGWAGFGARDGQP